MRVINRIRIRIGIKVKIRELWRLKMEPWRADTISGGVKA
jgi:hypothetical protein